MKKIFYILAAAIVALGTVACENEGLDNINPNINVDGDTVSFVAGINRTDLDGTATVWDADDTIVVTWNKNNYEFTNVGQKDENTFSCTAEGLSAIVNAESIKAVYSNNKDGKVDSAAGVAGALLEYEGAFGNIAFEVKNAFLKFKANEGSEVKFTASEEIFSTGAELTLTATGEDQYVAVIPATTTITYALDGVVCTTSKENTLKARKIYPLSTLDKVVVIKTKEDFLTFAEAVNNGTSYEGYTVKVVKDIELTEAWTPVGQTGATQFHGTFDGQGHTIKGLTINAPESYSTNYATGMFGWVETGAVIKNIVLDKANINGYHYVGAIAGYMSGSAKIEGCKVINSEIVADPTKKDTAGEFNGDKVGGIVGYTNGSNVISGNEVSKTTIKGYRHMGGIVGYLLGTAENNTVDDTVVITVNNDNNYKKYAIQSNYGVNNIAGVVTGTATNNNGEVTIVWGDIPATLVNYVAQVGEDKYETIKDAIAAAKASGVSEIVIIDNVDLAEDSLSGFAGTIKGGEDVVLDFSNFPAASTYAFPISGTTTFKDITFKFPAGSSSYLSAGLVGEGEFTFENCAFEGCFTINGNAEWAFNKCTFTNNEYYASFVYAAKEVVFTECSFSGKDRAAKIYGDGGDLYVEYHNCKFTSTTTNKAAIAIDATFANTIVIVDKDCSQTNMNGLYSLDGTKGVVNPVAKDNNGKLYGSFEAALEASSTIELLADIESEAIITINKNITINGNNKTINSTAARAINIATEGEVTIKNLTVVATGERAVNVITYPAIVKLEGVNLTAANYTVNVAGSAGAAKVAITNSTLRGLNTVNINGKGAKVTIDGCEIYCNDNNPTEGEDYAALCLGRDAVGGSIAATNSKIYVPEDSDSTKGCNNASDGTITIDDSTDGVVVKYAAIIVGDYYYAFNTVDEAIEFDETATITLLRPATIGTEGTYTIDVNDHELSAAENFILTDNLDGTYTVVAAKAKVGTTLYATLADAIDNANGATVTLLADIDGTVTLDKACTINTNGKNFDYTVEGDFRDDVDGSNVITISPATYVLYVTNTMGWSKLNVYAWSDSITAPTWPGVEMNYDEDNDVYYYDFGKNVGTFNYIINDGIDQTPDLSATMTTKGVEYDLCGNTFLTPGCWNVDGAWFAAYFHTDGKWAKMYDGDGDGVYACYNPNGSTGCNMVRMSAGTASNTTSSRYNWGNKWNQTNNVTLSKGNHVKVTGWNEGNFTQSTK